MILWSHNDFLSRRMHYLVWIYCCKICRPISYFYIALFALFLFLNELSEDPLDGQTYNKNSVMRCALKSEW